MKTAKTNLQAITPFVLLIGGIIGLIASFIIMDDTLRLARNPHFQPSCSLNPVISCGTVMKSSEAHLFGFDNPYIGLAAFPVLIFAGVLLLSGVRLRRWHWLGLNIGALFGVGFVHWLFFESVYRIRALCPYCMAVWAVTIAVFWYLTLYNLQAGYLMPRAGLHRVSLFIQRHHADLLMIWFVTLAGLIVHHFWYYFGLYL